MQVANPSVIATQLTLHDFMKGKYYSDYTEYFDIEDDDYASISSRFERARNIFLGQEICAETVYNVTCPNSITSFNLKQALF